jgi:hypothetical protein
MVTQSLCACGRPFGLANGEPLTAGHMGILPPVGAHFLVHPDAEIVLSQPGLGRQLTGRCLSGTRTFRMVLCSRSRRTRGPLSWVLSEQGNLTTLQACHHQK